MGAQDNLDMAKDFVERTGTESFTMIWDESFESWNYYQIRGQPSAILVDPDGQPIKGWFGRFPLNEVVELASEYV